MALPILQFPRGILVEIMRYFDFQERLFLSLTSSKANIVSRFREVRLPEQYKLDVKWTEEEGEIEVFGTDVDGEKYKVYTVKTTYEPFQANNRVYIKNVSLKASVTPLSMNIKSRRQPLALGIVLEHFIRMGIKTISNITLKNWIPEVQKFAIDVLRKQRVHYERVCFNVYPDKKNNAGRMYYFFLQNCVEFECGVFFKKRKPIIGKNTSRLRKLSARYADWITAEEVLKLKHCEDFHLICSTFSDSELNKILSAWKRGKLSMESLECRTERPVLCGNIEEMLRGLDAKEIKMKSFNARMCIHMPRYRITRDDGTSGKLIIEPGIGKIKFIA